MHYYWLRFGASSSHIKQPIAAEDKRCARSLSELGRNPRVPPRRIADCVILRSRDRCRIDTDRAREL
uniref:Uncharacterized protein n=1 Tax=Trichogramma kaykai TaxID=54128 RepID=A0ABD2WSN9_9HYME